MKQFTLQSLVVVASVFFFAALAEADPRGSANGRVDAVAHNVEEHQVLYGSVYNYGSGFVFTISNGNRLYPLWLNAHFQFIDSSGRLIGEVVRGGWCAASLGGSARRCDCRFTGTGTAYWSGAAIIKMFGQRTSPLRRGGSGGCIS
jgi:hypothetical protein